MHTELPELKAVLRQEPAVKRALAEGDANCSLFTQVAVSSMGEPGWFVKQSDCAAQLVDAKLTPRRSTSHLSEWLTAVFEFQIPRGLHRWLGWGAEQHELAVHSPPIVRAALASLNAAPLAASNQTSRRCNWPEPSDAARKLRGMLLRHDTAAASMAALIAEFAQLAEREQILFCAGMSLHQMCNKCKVHTGMSLPCGWYLGQGIPALLCTFIAVSLCKARAVSLNVDCASHKLSAPLDKGCMFAGALLHLSHAKTTLAEAAFIFQLSPANPALLSLPPENPHHVHHFIRASSLQLMGLNKASSQRPHSDVHIEKQRQLWSLPAIAADVMAQAEAVQSDRGLVATLWTSAGGLPRPMLPVDTIIMDEAACSTDYVMPCLLVMRPQHLVRDFKFSCLWLCELCELWLAFCVASWLFLLVAVWALWLSACGGSWLAV